MKGKILASVAFVLFLALSLSACEEPVTNNYYNSTTTNNNYYGSSSVTGQPSVTPDFINKMQTSPEPW